MYYYYCKKTEFERVDINVIRTIVGFKKKVKYEAWWIIFREKTQMISIYIYIIHNNFI